MTASRSDIEEKIAELNDPKGPKNFSLVDIQATDEDLFKIAAAIKTNTTLESFHLGTIKDYKDYGLLAGIPARLVVWPSDGIAALGDALKHHPTINKLSIDTNSGGSLNPRHTLGLLKAIAGSAKIKELYVEVQHAEKDFVTLLSAALRVNNTLEKLEFKLFETYRDCYPIQHWECLADSLINKNITVFNLQSWGLGDTGLSAIAPMLASMSTLERLEIVGCNISYKSVNVINSILSKVRCLQALSLNDNHELQDNIIPVLESQLPKLPALRCLRLRDIGITVDGLKRVIDIIPSLKIEIFDIHGHGFNRSILPHVDRLIVQMPSLRKLSVYSPDVTNKQTEFLSDPEKCKIRRYYFGGLPGGLANIAIEQIYSIMAKNPYISDMGIENTNLIAGAFSINFFRQTLIRQRCLDYLVLLANLFYSPDLPLMLPRELKLKILEEVLSVFLDIRLQPTWNLLFTNFSTRRSMINAKKYDPVSKNISAWWNKGSLFKARTQWKGILFEEPLDKQTEKVLEMESEGIYSMYRKRRV